MNGVFAHKDLAAGRWYQMNLSEQMGNIGSEVSRANLSQGKNNERFEVAVDRALELFDLTLSDLRWRGRLQEIGRAREVFCDAVYGGKEYGSSLKSLQSYFDHFAIATLNKKHA
ncbi:MAG: hypothetical protein A2664_00480 [Candidatus Taylorbacteria bacterium RIFCSPHIGHO2_01_FULL_46_22b]|uniref:Uncharacterized protein n=1 Tax=Candidatus Taylorbacteria bacterium RIFCSPHIGHO2_01_FULL_46_22b TaxID=1802301 RepID=A0A1G2M2C8_9BACT|nr:MAG: hypothetical protein A2664_00480 [Candidatus Taylorbacteria bacterium RIFCSPHIGHO2_01_FULL_46_22b]